MEVLDTLIHTPYSSIQPGGLVGFIDQFMTALHELEILQNEEYSDSAKKRFLLKNIKGVHGAAHLVQKCRDDFTVSFEKMTQYLQENSKNIEGENPSRKRLMVAASEEEQSGERQTHTYLTLQETSDLFESVARESSVFNAYKSLLP